jgi:hypothetical protein
MSASEPGSGVLQANRRAVSIGACAGGLLALVLLAGREPVPPPPKAFWLGALPVQGALADALHAGFARCLETTRKLRCRKEGVMLVGQGPYSAAVDLRAADGRGGFEGITLWHQWDQQAVGAVGDVLEARGWKLCRTGPHEFRGDQQIYTRAGAPVRFSMDLSYWGKRRLRVLPERGQPTGHCW